MGALVRSWSMRLGLTVQMQRREFDKRLTDVLSVFLRHLRWLMVRRKSTAMPVVGQGHSPVRRYTAPPPAHRAHGNQGGVIDGDRGSTRVGETPGKRVGGTGRGKGRSTRVAHTSDSAAQTGRADVQAGLTAKRRMVGETGE